MALHLLFLTTTVLCVLAAAGTPQCETSCLPAPPSGCSGTTVGGHAVHCSGDHARGALVSICAEHESTPDERGIPYDSLRVLCDSSHDREAASVVQSHAGEQPAGITVASPFTKRDDDDDDDDDGDGDSSRHSNVGAAIGGTIGGIAAVAILAAVYIHHRRRRQRRPRQPKKRRRAEIDPEEDTHDQSRPPQISQPSSGSYAPVAQHDAEAPPLVPPKDAEAERGAGGPPAYDHIGGPSTSQKPS